MVCRVEIKDNFANHKLIFMKKSTPNLPMSSRMQPPGGAKEMPKTMPKKGSKKAMPAKKAIPAKKGY